MRKILMLTLAASALATAITPTAASAQSGRELRHDQREIARDRAEIRGDMARGDYREARHDRHELRDDRREMREDWRDYRDAHRDRFHGPAYVAPRGFAYRPVAPGYRFDPPYYGRRYWINDPGYYRLPVLPPHQRWVRYGRDVVRVDIGSGRVLQVYGSFFL